ncbi:aldose epimerase [Sporolactobacillus kofuensis]|uniref:Aldose epimerase n=1 Tax=Sporolactobacillus kofuensis TaxID=269672 RepID=A0ABW1WDW0_9BACL|nr:aldose epimerase [Sporolactobacillus kofuensis]MCO7176128.1 aldose epimerase [Sporolactobacillus kofuensis]
MVDYGVSSYEENGLTFIRLSGIEAYVIICPERGGIVSTFNIIGKDVLYLKKDTLFDPSKNVRGGIPVLFPMAGQLPDKSYLLGNKTYIMENHGLARQRPWQVIDQKSEQSYAEVTLQFASDKSTLEQFPFEFEVVFTYVLSGEKLTIRQSYRNQSESKMPIYPGFHPYFNIKNKHLLLNTKTSSYIDYNDQKVKSFNGEIDLTNLPEAVVYADDSDKIVAPFDKDTKLVIEKSKAFRYVMLWSEPGHDYVCIEPWTAKKNEYNEKKELIYVERDHPFEVEISIALEH